MCWVRAFGFGDRALEIPFGFPSAEILDKVQNMKHRNLTVELLERLLKDDIKARFSTNVVQSARFSDILKASLTRYRNRAIETAQVVEELIQMAKAFNDAFQRGIDLGLAPEEMALYDALEDNEALVRELGGSELKAIGRELPDDRRNNPKTDSSVRESVRATMKVRIKRILKRHRYLPEMELRAVGHVLKQAEVQSGAWVA
ncbi:type I restriction enzyme endonuclease domain-containing protein [Geothrix sp. 21YS21S-2]|uniref:type I restriction enzyme endonuclease domain-containing protein n=1 Tax=Geothrix sp. 21YS21S-2 TaxID=3068893 RepID=UPI0027BA7A80|nr:type I restriction enzyme endonuclease domain-containing protein [Geothrix sp. 21YS21S-2]